MNFMKTLYLRHKGMTILCFISVLLMVLYLITLDVPEWFHSGGQLFEVLFQISIGYLINYIFFIVNVYVPKITIEDKALISTKYKIARLLSEIDSVENIFNSFIKLNYGRIHFKPGIIFFKRKDFETRDFMDLNIYLKMEHLILIKKIEEIISIRYFYDLNPKIIELVNDIQYSEFISYLERFSKYEMDLNNFICGTNKYTILLEDAYKEFKVLAEELSKMVCVEKSPEVNFILLNDEEINEYVLFIQDAQKKHKGKFDPNSKYYTQEGKRYK